MTLRTAPKCASYIILTCFPRKEFISELQNCKVVFCTSSSEIVRGTEPTNSLTNIPPSAASGENNELISTYMLGFDILCGVFFTSSRGTCCNADELLPSSHTLQIIPNWFIKAKCCLLYIHTYIYIYKDTHVHKYCEFLRTYNFRECEKN